MSREPSRNRRRLAALAAFGLFWGAFLVTIGFRPLHVVILIAGLLGVAALALEGRCAAAVLRPALGPHARRAGARAAGGGRAVGSAAIGASRAASARVARIDWQGLRGKAHRRGESAGRVGRRARVTAGELAAAASRRTVAAGGAVVTAVERQARSLRRNLADARRRSDALRLNEQAGVLRQEGRYEQALEASERALELFRSVGDRRSEALTLNGIGLAQARTGDESGALDSYETAVALLSDQGDGHGAGRVLANLGMLHLGQGQDEQARAAWQDALERLEPGSPEHDQTAQQLRSAG
jgi:tetratricopeptide (TPR) repeat protein